jgi:6-phospho-beta-glucosidase
VPSYYLRYYYAFEEVLAEQRGGHHRAEEVMELERRLLKMYADPTLDTKPALLNDRGGAFYSEAAAQLLASLHDGAGDVQVVDVRNDGALSELDPDDVVEVPARITRDGAQPLPQGPMDPEMLELVRSVKAFERLAIRAALSGDADDVRRALEAHPLVGPRIGDVRPLLAALLDANQPYLPRFAAVR